MEFKSVNKLLEKSFRDNWEKDALSNYQGGTLKYKDVARRVYFLHHFLFKNCGLQKGDKVALCSRNQSDWGVCFLSALTYGAVPVPILHEFKPENIRYLVNHCEARILFVDEMIWESLSGFEMPGLDAVVNMNTLECLSAGGGEFSGELGSLPELMAAQCPDDFSREDVVYCEDAPEDLAIINYTSGTSGYSKGVMIPFRAIYTNLYLAKYVAEPQMDSTSEMVSMLPCAHMYGLMFDFLYEMTIGAHVHFLTRVPSPNIILNALSEVKPDAVVTVPLILEKIYKNQLRPVLDRNRFFLKIPLVGRMVYRVIRNRLIDSFGGRFEEVIVGGAALNPDVERVLRKINFPFTVGYGMTECAPLITYEKWHRSRPGSCGKVIPGCEVRIDSSDPRNVPGEILVRGSNIFLGYYRNENATSEAFTSDGWFRTGDIGVLDKDGYLFLRGRSKCLILGPSGQNIYPEELESVINNTAYVVDSLVIEDAGSLVAIVYPDYRRAAHDGMGRSELEERLIGLLPQINGELPKYAQIKKIEFIQEDFERTPKKSIKRYVYQRN